MSGESNSILSDAGNGGGASAQVDGANPVSAAMNATAGDSGSSANPSLTESAAVDGNLTGQAADSGKEADTSSQEISSELSGAPAEYADFTLPEGVTADAALLGELKDLAKGLNLTQAQAQQLADLGLKQLQGVLSAQQQALTDQVKAWAEAAKTDKEFGGDKFEANLAVAKRAVDAFTTPELRALFDKTGLGNHPDMIRAFYKAGKLISEDALLPGGAKPAGAGPKSAADVLYGS